MPSLLDVIWILFIVYSLMPVIRQRRLESARIRLIQRIQSKRGTRVIVMIHRQEAISLLGIPLARFINIEDSEQILRAIRLTPGDVPIDLILHTPGGLVLAAEQIAHAIRKHKAPVAVFVPHYAMSGGTLLALAATKVFMDENAVLGPVDPQLGRYPAASILAAVQQKGRERLDDETLIMADLAEKAIDQMRAFVEEILKDKFEPEKAAALADALTEGRWTHDFPLLAGDLQKLGLPVEIGMPAEYYQLMELYPQPAARRPSVQYVPLPDRAARDL